MSRRDLPRPVGDARRTGGGDPERALRLDLEREPQSRLLRRVAAENRLVPHNFLVPVERLLDCPTCGRPYRVLLLPGQIVYPGHCEAHRTPHRRALHAGGVAAAA